MISRIVSRQLSGGVVSDFITRSFNNIIIQSNRAILAQRVMVRPTPIVQRELPQMNVSIATVIMTLGLISFPWEHMIMG